MPKLSDNQASAVASLKTLLEKTGAAAASLKQWKSSCESGVTLSAKSLVAHGAVKELKVTLLSNGTLTSIYHL